MKKVGGSAVRRATVLAVGAAFLVLSAVAFADDPTETAALTPGTETPEVDAALDAVLSFEDATRYRAIFGLQEAGQWRAADREIARLEDRRLLGHVLAQRYLHPTKYRSKYRELRDWLEHYADHPDAPRIYRLALRRKPAAAKPPRPPQGGYYVARTETSAPAEVDFRSTKRLSGKQRRQVRAIKARIRSRLRRGWPTGAKALLDGPAARRLFDRLEIDLARAEIAASYYRYGKYREALAEADAVADHSSRQAPMAHWYGGLSAWRLGLWDRAAAQFEALARARSVSGWSQAAGAYWAARAHLVARRPAEVSRWLELAASRSHTFYGMLAGRALGQAPGFDWVVPALGTADVARVIAEPAGARALALLQAGQRVRAEQELRRIKPADPAMLRALVALALRTALPRLAIGLAGAAEALDGRPIEAAYFPLPAWAPEGGFQVDRALLFALMRQESRFNAWAKSRAGARGLMQLMPRTASFIARDRSLRGQSRYKLFEPAFNMALGQKYVRHLLGNKTVQDNLFRLAAAYNGGPGNLAKWQRKADFGDDPLLFIESLPSRETRLFIERVLANLWIYRDQLGQPTPSLDAIAAGNWPRYISLDGADRAVATNGAD